MKCLILKQKLITIGIILLLTTIGFFGVLVLEGILDKGHSNASTTLYVGGSGFGNFSKIQDAISSASTGDTIRIYSGLYIENIVIDKNVSLIGNGSADTIIDGNGSGDVIRITESGVKVSGLQIRNSGNRGSPGLDSGIELDKVQNVMISEVNCSNNFFGIFFNNSEINTIKNNICTSNNKSGISLDHSNSNIITNNTCCSNNLSNIFSFYSNSNKIKNNTCNNSKTFSSIYLGHSDHNEIINNDCNKNRNSGILLHYSDSNIIMGNFCNFSGSKDGIVSSFSIHNIIKNNTMHGCSLALDGSKLEHWTTHTIDYTNQVNGKAVYYWKNRTNGKIPSNVAQIILANCTNINIENLKIINIAEPIAIGFSSFITIANNTLIGNKPGIYVQESEYNIITNNTFDLNDLFGIFLGHSNSNVIHNNSVSNTSGFGIGVYLAFSDRNIISNNTCTLNYESGIRLDDSEYNTIIHNNASFNRMYGIFINEYSDSSIIKENHIFKNLEIGLLVNDSGKTSIYYNHLIHNFIQAKELGSGYNNHWDNGNEEGNYWSDYYGLDNGANGRVAGDGIGDTDIPHLGLDNYPFINSSGWLYPGIPRLLQPVPDSGNVDSDGNYTISWLINRCTTEFYLEEATTDEFNSPVTIYNGSELLHDISTKPNGTYYYRLKACNENFESPWSNLVNITIDWPPDIPQNLNVSVYPYGNTLNITWQPNIVDTKEYELYYTNDLNGTWLRAGIKLHPNDNLNHTALVDGVEYFYKIKARDNRGQESKFSTIVKGIPADSIAPAPPTGLKVNSTTNNSITLVWEPNTEADLTGYCIYKSNMSNPPYWGFPIGAVWAKEKTYTDKNLDEISTYYYVITAFDEVPNESNYSLQTSGTTKLDKHAPEINYPLSDFTMLEDTIDDSSIKLVDWFKDINNDNLTYRCRQNLFIDIIIDKKNGSVTVIPTSDWSGSETIVFYCSDGEFEISDNVTITVLQVNDPPEQPEIILPEDGLEIREGEPLNLEGQCYDADLSYGDELTFTWLSDLEGELGSGKNLHRIKLPAGSHQITLSVSDLAGNSSYTSVNVTVLKTESSAFFDVNIAVTSFLMVIIILLISIIVIRGKISRKHKKGETISKGFSASTQTINELPLGPPSSSISSRFDFTSRVTPIQPTMKLPVEEPKVPLQSTPSTQKAQLLDYEIKLIGRENELNKLQGYLTSALDNSGNTLFIFGEAGIGKTRLVTELIQIAKMKGFQILSSNCLYESLTPFMPIRNALDSGGLDYLFVEEVPRIEAIYLVSHTGLLIKEVIREETKLDPAIFTSLLTTISNFVKESLSILSDDEKEGSLNTLGFENYRIIIEIGVSSNLVVILSGKENEFLIKDTKDALANVDSIYGHMLQDWDGVLENIEGIDRLIKPLITSGKYDGMYTEETDPKTKRNLLFENVTLGLVRESQSKPILLNIEDLQWSDPSSLALLHHISRNSKDSRLVILGTYRPEEVTLKEGVDEPLKEIVQLMDREDLLTKMELSRLPEESVTRMVISMLGGMEIADEVKNLIYRETEGNPLFVIEFTKYLLEEKIIIYSSGTWNLAQKLEELNIPPKVYQVIVRRLSRLEKTHRRLLDYASVAGETFNSSTLGEALKVDRLELLERLRELEQKHRIIYSEDGNYKFTHAKLKEVIYDEIPHELQMEYHLIIANAIENLNKENIDNVLENLAYHYYQSKNKVKAPFYLIKAAQKAKKNYSNSEAIKFYNEALALESEPAKKRDILDSLGEIYDLMGEYDCSLETYNRALELTGEPERLAGIKAKLGILHLKKGDYDKSILQSNEALALVENKNVKESALAFETLGYTYHRRGEYDKAFKHHKKSLEIREKLGDSKSIGTSTKNLGMVLLDRGEYDNALKYFESSLKVFETIGDAQGIQLCLSKIGAVFFNKGEYEKAFEYYEKSFRIIENTGDQTNIAILLLNIGQSLLLKGEPDKAIENLRKSLELGESNNLQMVIACDYWVMAEAYIEKGDLNKALDYCNRAFNLSSEIGAKEIIAALNKVFGIIYKNQGKWEASIENFEASSKILKEIGNIKELGDTYYEFGLMWHAKGDIRKARENLKEAINIFKKLKLDRKKAKTLRILEAL